MKKNVWHNKLKRSKSLLWLGVSQWLFPISFSLWHSSIFWWDCVTEEATQVMHPASKDRRKKWTSFQHPPLGHTSKTSYPSGSTISQYLFSPVTKDFTLGLWGHISDLHYIRHQRLHLPWWRHLTEWPEYMCVAAACGMDYSVGIQ